MTNKNEKAESAIIASRVKLLLNYPFFGSLALHLRVVERPEIGTAATDGRNYFYNPDFINSLERKEVNFLTVHEVLHPALGHLWRRGTRDQVIFNHAADYVINAMIKESDPNEDSFKMPKGGLYDKKFEGMSTEEVYDILIQDQEYVKNAHAQAGQGQKGMDNHDVWSEGSNGQGDGEDGDGKGGQGQTSADEWQSRVIQAAQVAEAKGKGKLPSSISRIVQNLTAPQKNWKQEIAEMVQFEVNDYGFSPPDRRFLYSDLILPDFSEENEVVKNIYWVIDTSGSINTEMLKVFISEAVGCMAQFGGKVQGKVIYADSKVQAVYDLEDIVESPPKGGGGTDFRPVFEYIEKDEEENNVEPAGVIFITDGYGDYPKHEPDYPVLWVLTNEYNVPWGRTTQIKA